MLEEIREPEGSVGFLDVVRCNGRANLAFDRVECDGRGPAEAVKHAKADAKYPAVCQHFMKLGDLERLNFYTNRPNGQHEV